MGKNSYLKILFGLVILAALLAGVVLVKKTQETRRGAAGESVGISISPENGSYLVGDTITSYIYFSQLSDKNISSYFLKIIYSESHLNLITSSIADAEVDGIASVYSFSGGNGQVELVGGLEGLTSDNSVKVAKLEFEVIAEGQAVINLGSGGEVVVCQNTGSGTCQPGTEEEITNFSFTPATYSLTGGGAAQGPEIQLSLSPLDGGKKRNENFRVELYADSGTNKIDLATVVFNFSPQRLELIDIEAPTGSGNPFDRLEEDINSGTVKITLIASRQDSQLASGRFLVATYVLKPLALGTATFSFDAGLSEFSGKTANGEYWTDERLVPSNLAGVYTITDDSVGDDPVMSFRIKFNRVNWQIPNQQVLVKVVKSDFREEFSGVTVTSDESGVLSGSLSLVGVPTGGGYQIIIKGPKHLADKFCSDGQQGRCQWGQSITINQTNDFDFTGLALEAGDIPDTNGVQDGVVDAKDFSALKSALNSSDAVLRDRVNLDFDQSDDGGAIIGGRDISLFLSTMSQRYDDDN